MAVYVFPGADEREVLRKAVNFWHKRFGEAMTLMDFLKRCRRAVAVRPPKKEPELFIIYQGPRPPSRRSGRAGDHRINGGNHDNG